MNGFDQNKDTADVSNKKLCFENSNDTSINIYKDYPPYNPPFLARESRNSYETCLAYALNHRLRGPDLYDIKKHLKKNSVLNYVVSELNSFYGDPELALIADYEPGKVPKMKPGYYVIALTISAPDDQNEAFTKKLDFHFLVQNNDGFFSHRRGMAKAERVDSNNKLIEIPEQSTFTYLIPKNYGSPTCYDYKFMGYIYVKAKDRRIQSMQEQFEIFTPQIPDISSADWCIKGNFKFDGYHARWLQLKNNSPNKNVKHIDFKGCKNGVLEMYVKFKSLDMCNYFIDLCLPYISDKTSLFFDEKKINFRPTNQKDFDVFLKTIHLVDPINEKLYDELSTLLNTIPPKPNEWSNEYPVFDPNSIGRYGDSKFDAGENCLNYALDINESGIGCAVSIFHLNSLKSNAEKLAYVAKTINTYYSDEHFVEVAPFQSGSLPKERPGYYLVSLAFSRGREDYQSDYHFLRQDQDKRFSHRRGQGYKAEKSDSEGKDIAIPEFSKLTYESKKNRTLDYQFVGYLYVKCNTLRLKNLLLNSQYQLDYLKKNQNSSTAHQEIYQQFNKEFYQFPLPEFFADARSIVSKYEVQMKKLKAAILSKHHFLNKNTNQHAEPILENDARLAKRAS